MHNGPIVCVVDDDAETRSVLRTLGQAEGLAVETYADAVTFLRSYDPARPGCLVVDAWMETMSGLQLQRELAARKASLPTIMTIPRSDVTTAVEAMKAGAFDVVERPFLRFRILPVIRRAIANDLATRRHNTECSTLKRRYKYLTPRERQVLQLVANGLTSKDIAVRLALHSRTVETYRSRIKRKMQARNAADLVRMVHSVS